MQANPFAADRETFAELLEERETRRKRFIYSSVVVNTIMVLCLLGALYYWVFVHEGSTNAPEAIKLIISFAAPSLSALGSFTLWKEIGECKVQIITLHSLIRAVDQFVASPDASSAASVGDPCEAVVSVKERVNAYLKALNKP
jgi:hypothetical protein